MADADGHSRVGGVRSADRDAVSRARRSRACSRGCGASPTARASKCSRRRFTNISFRARRASRASRFERMRQHVTIAPLRDRDGIVGVVVTIEDVTAPFERERRLAADLDSEDEATRLRAAKTLAAAGESPVLLAGLADRRELARAARRRGGTGDGGGRDVIDDARRSAARSSPRSGAAQRRAHRARAHARRRRDDGRRAARAADAEVRTYAALALGLMGDSRAVPALMARLDDADTNVRFHAIEALGRIRDGDAADALVDDRRGARLLPFVRRARCAGRDRRADGRRRA